MIATYEFLEQEENINIFNRNCQRGVVIMVKDNFLSWIRKEYCFKDLILTVKIKNKKYDYDKLKDQ